MLRDYQSKLKNDIYEGWRSGHRNMIAVAPTGAGKTVVISSIFKDMENEFGLAIAHRQELVSQISCAIASQGIYHNILAPDPVIRFIINQHIEKFGKNFYHPRCTIGVAGIDTMNARHEQHSQLFARQKLWLGDECHHFLPDNKWGKGVARLKNALGGGFTATPRRTDRKPLGAKYGGLFHKMALAPSQRELINLGHLCDYRIFAPKSSIDMSHVRVSERTGNFNEHEKVEASDKSQIVGDIVEQYLKITPGKIGITFVPSVKQAKEVAARFNQAGVPAECVHGGSDDTFRTNSIKAHARGDLKQLVNVGLFGEGFDVPVCEVVSDGDPTMSLTDFMQRFGRMLRKAPGKTHGTYIDHVENVLRHGLPDAPREWSLDIDYRGTSRGRDENVMPVRQCIRCDGAYEAITKRCPYCGYIDEPSPTARSYPDQVDGDLIEFSPDLLARLRGEIDRNEAVWDGSVNSSREAGIRKAMNARHDALQELRDTMNYWAGIQIYGMERSESETYRRFFHKYGIDVLSAQTLSAPEMRALTEKIRLDTI